MPSFSVLKKRRDFVRISKSGESFASKTVVVQTAPSGLPEKNGKSRIGYTTTKKIGKAYIRNRCRRRLRAVAALFFAKYAMPDFDYVLIARYSTAQADFNSLCQDLCYAIKKVNSRFLEKEIATQNSDISGDNSDKNVSETLISDNA